MKPRTPVQTATRVILVAGLIGVCVLFSGRQERSWAIDADGDGMSDVWQLQHGIISGDTNSDPDVDGYSNLVEAQFRTDPNPNTSPETDMVSVGLFDLQGSDPCVSWYGFFGVRYAVDRTTDLQGWSNVAGPIDPEEDSITAYLVSSYPASSIPRQFFRVSVMPGLDEDADGLDAWEETSLETLVNNPDSDGDGVEDGTEFTENSDPNDPASSSTALIGMRLFTPLE